MGQARRDRQVSDRAAGRHPGRTRGHAGEPGRGLGVGGVRHGGTPAQRGQAGGHLDRGPDHRRWPRHTPARRRRAAGDFRRQHLRDLGWQTLTDRSDQQGGHLELGARPRRDITNTISRALFDGLPATEPLRVPAVPEAGTPSTWVPGARVGSVLQAQTAGGGSQFYVLLPDGVQKISSFVADLLRSANSYGAAAPRVVTPDVLVHTPQVTSLPVEYYPAGRLNFVDTAADPTTCVSWEKASTDPQARVAVYNGRGLPVPPSMDSRIVRLVRDDRAPASVVATQVLVLPGAANFVTSTSGVITAESRESLFWVSGNGVRFGIANDEATLRALGLDPGAAVQAPWPLLRTFAAGPALSRDAALLARDTVPTLGQVAIVTTTAKAGA